MMRLPVTLALACALEDRGNLFSAAQAMLEGDMPTAAAPMVELLRDIIGPLLDMGAVYSDAAGEKRIDRQAICDFGIVYCGLPRQTVLHELSLHEIALYHRRLAAQRTAARAVGLACADSQEGYENERHSQTK